MKGAYLPAITAKCLCPAGCEANCSLSCDRSPFNKLISCSVGSIFCQPTHYGSACFCSPGYQGSVCAECKWKVVLFQMVSACP